MMVGDDIWNSEVPPPNLVTGRRRGITWSLLGTGVVTGALAIVGSSMTWTDWISGGDSSPVTLSGLNSAEAGTWTLILGGAVVLAGVLASVLVGPHRSVVLALPAAGGLVLAAVSCARTVSLPTGRLVGAEVGTGLALVMAGYCLAVLVVPILWVLDCHWRSRDRPSPASDRTQSGT